VAGAFNFDFDAIDQLVADIDQAADGTGENLRKAIEVTSINIKQAWQEPLRGSATLPVLPLAVTYDIDVAVFGLGSAIRSSIGFDKSRGQGALGNISEYGTPAIPGRGFGIRALEANQADFQRGIERAVDDALRKAGL